MIRVIYRWRVTPETAPDFPRWWHEGTVRIRATHRGALGSTLLRSDDDPSVFVGIAQWESVDALEEFRQDAAPLLFDGAQIEHIEQFQELDDLTISRPLD